MSIVKNIKNLFSDHFVSNEYDEYDSAVGPDDYEDEEQESDSLPGNIYASDDEDSTADDYSYSPQSTINAPEYNFSEKKETKTPKRETPKSGASIYNMNAARPANKFKLNSILLRDIYDAKNVASLMMEKDTIVVVNLSLLTEDQKVRAMDFLDGAKFVTKSVFARFAENICAFVPETVELFGDFFSQVDLESFK